jgi:hypothetical protein
MAANLVLSERFRLKTWTAICTSSCPSVRTCIRPNDEVLMSSQNSKFLGRHFRPKSSKKLNDGSESFYLSTCDVIETYSEKEGTPVV